MLCDIDRVNIFTHFADNTDQAKSWLLLRSRLWRRVKVLQSVFSSQKFANFLMFRLLLLSFIALRVIACPLCCAGGGEYAHGLGAEVGTLHSDSCCKSDDKPCGEGDVPPADSPCPCEGGCECQITPETHHRVVVDVQWMLDFVPLSLDTLDLSETFVLRFEAQPRRLDLPTGRSVRLAHASLLI